MHHVLLPYRCSDLISLCSLEIKPGSNGSLSEIRGCICTVIPQNLGLPSTEVTNVLWNNVLDTIPQWISAVIERAKKS